MSKDYKPIRRAKKSIFQILFGRTAVIMILLAVHFFLLFGLLMKLTSAMPYYIGGMTMHGARVAELLISGEFHGCQKRTRSMTGIALSSASQIIRWSEEAIEQHIAAGYSTREEIEEARAL